MALVEDSLSTTTLQDWQPGAAQQNAAITKLCQQSNWVLAAGGGWQWQHGSRIVNTGTILSGTQFWPVVCSPFGGVSLRVSVYGKCSSGGSDQIGIYLSDSWPFGAGVQMGTLTIPGTAAVATATIDTQNYFNPVLIYLKAETNIDDLELQGFRGRLVGAEPDGTALQYQDIFNRTMRFLQEKEFADTSPLTAALIMQGIHDASTPKLWRGRSSLNVCYDGGQVRNAEELTQASGGANQVLFANVRARFGAFTRCYVRSYQQTSSGDDSVIFIMNGAENSLELNTTGTQTQNVWEGWQILGVVLEPYGSLAIISAIYASDPDSGQGHVIQDISIISGLF